MAPYKNLFVIISLLICAFTNAQSRAIDSLKNSLPKVNDSLRVNNCNELAKLYRKAGSYDSALEYADAARTLAEKIKYKKGLGQAYTNLGNAAKGKSAFYEALGWYEKGLVVKQELKDTLGVAFSYNNIGNIYRDQGKFSEALKYFFMCLRGCESIHDTLGIAGSFNNIGLVYSYMHNDPEAIKYHRAALDIRLKSGDLEGVAASYGNLALTYGHQKNYAEALRSHEASYKIEEDLGSKAGMSNSLIGSANIKARIGKYDEALSDYQRSLSLSKEIGDKENISIIMVNMARLNFSRGLLREAETEAKQGLALALELNALQTVMEGYEILSQAYEKMGKHKEALGAYMKFIASRDSLSNEENTKRTVQLEMQYQFDKKEEAARLDQQKKDAIAVADKRRQNMVLAAVSGFGILVLLFALFAYRSFRQKKKINIEITRQKELIEEKQKEVLDSIYYARRIQRALLTPEKYIERVLKHR